MTTDDEITIGIILRPHGLKGMVKVIPTTDDPKRFLQLKKVSIHRGGHLLGRHHLEQVILDHKNLRLKFREFETCDAVESLRGAELTIPRSECLTTQENQYYHFDLIGLPVYTLNGDRIGTIFDIISNPANDVWIVRNSDQRECLIPAIKSVINKVSIEERKIVINPIDGLLDDFLNSSKL